MSNILSGQRGLIMGVANDRSIAWGIARALHEAGAELAFTHQGEAFGKRLEPLAQSIGSDFMVDVDVTDDASLEAAFAALAERWPTIDFLVALNQRLERDIDYVVRLEPGVTELVIGGALLRVREDFIGLFDILEFSLGLCIA